MDIQSQHGYNYMWTSYPSQSNGHLSAASAPSDESKKGNGPIESSEQGNEEGNLKDGLTEEEQQVVRNLQQRDREVRQHEQAHAAAAGQLANGGPQYEYTTGPDDKQYATGGHVSISLREGATPEESISLAQQAQRAALAPLEPSAQDYKVAAQAAAMELEAKAELKEESYEQLNLGIWAPQPPKESPTNAYGQPSSTPPGSVLYEFA